MREIQDGVPMLDCPPAQPGDIPDNTKEQLQELFELGRKFKPPIGEHEIGDALGAYHAANGGDWAKARTKLIADLKLKLEIAPVQATENPAFTESKTRNQIELELSAMTGSARAQVLESFLGILRTRKLDPDNAADYRKPAYT